MSHKFLLTLALALPLALQAQTPEPDEEGCKDSAIISRVPGCRISECSRKAFDSADLTTAKLPEDQWKTETVEGETEINHYECVESVSLLQIARNAEAALRKAGFTIIYSGKSPAESQPMVTARAGGRWVEVRTWDNGGPLYIQTVVKAEEMLQEVVVSADAWAAEIEKTGRVAVYGITFDTGKAAITPASSKVLEEILALLSAHQDWKIRLEGHTDNVGAKAANQTLSDQRAASVVAWLVSHGVDKGRLAAQGFGDSKPVAENTTDEGRSKNRRVELVKM